jgi:2,5-diketo-D-gluconate reductase B
MNPAVEARAVETHGQVVEAHGARVPVIGLGTWELRGSSCARLVEQALCLGYRHVDTAEIYDNEREVGEGLRASGIARDQVFITTKVWPSHFAPHELERAAKESLARLRLDRSVAAALAEPADPVVRDARCAL